MSKTIKGFSLNGNERFHPGEAEAVKTNTSIVEMTMPELKEGEILAETLYTAICGSDVSASPLTNFCNWKNEKKTII